MGDEEDENKTKQIIVRVTKSRKNEWKEAVDEAGFGTLAAGIRAAMQSEYFPDETESMGEPEPSPVEIESIDVDFDSVENKLDTVLERIDDIDTNSETIDENVSVEIISFASSVLDYLPHVEDRDELPSVEEVEQTDDDNLHDWDIFLKTGSMMHFTRQSDHDNFKVRYGLNWLEKIADEVHSVGTETKQFYILDEVENNE